LNDSLLRVRQTLAVFIVGVLSASVQGCGGGGPTTNNTPPPSPPPGTGGFEIAFSTYIGGSQFEEFREPSILPDGRLLVGSRTLSNDMPVTSGTYQTSHGGGQGDSWIGILQADGSRLDAATYFGGSGMERPPYGLVALPGGDIVFASGTTSPNIPTNSQSFARTIANPIPSPGDGYACRISGDLRSLRWCTYTSGGWPRGGVVADAADNVWVIGRATASGFVTTPSALQTSIRGADDAFLLKLSSDGSQALYSTRIGGSSGVSGEVALSLRVDATGSVRATGNAWSTDFPTTTGAAQSGSTGPADGWAMSLDSSQQVEFVTFVGGSDDDFVGHGSVALADGSLLLVGLTRSSDLPGGGVGASRTAYVALVSPDGSTVRYSVPAGGTHFDEVLGPVIDASGRLYVFGLTSASNLPVTANALQRNYGGDEDGYLLVLGPDRSTIEYATYIGGSGADMVRGIAIAPSGAVFVVGRTRSDDFPILAALQSQRGGDDDGFVMRLDPR
jgi:hypothetical protein